MLKPRIKEYIDNKGMKQVFVARQIGVTPQQLNNWIRNASYPHLNTAYKLAKFLEVPLDELYIYEEDEE